MKDFIKEKILPNVRQPARYIGNELNSVHKDWDKIDLKIALSYPDTYEIGMSNLAIQILYYIINNQDYALAERVFAPWPDMEEELIKNKIKLPSLESFKPLSEFNLIGFGIGHELTYANIYNMLKLGGVSPWRKDRKDSDPLVMGGGPCTYNPTPIEDFFDFFVLGEAETLIVDILETLRRTSTKSRATKLEELAKLPGIYVPSLKNKVTKQYEKDFTNLPYPTKPIIPFIEAVHDRAVVEIMRGCKWGCKFCHAGWTTRPVREKKIEKVNQLADELIKNTGYQEISLVSLSTSDYRKIDELAKTLAQKYEKKRINIALPSMRTNTFSVKLAKEISRVRPSGITVAPEAGTQRLRDVIGKNMSEEDIINGITSAFSEGIEAIKLYFMLGLPTETDEDVRGIGELAQKILRIGRGITNRARITVNLSTFIPKPHTPLQWNQQISIEETLQKQDLIKNSIKNKKGIKIRWHKAESSYLEGVFSRGDQKLAKVVEKAWELGARLDAWYEHFKFDIWLEAFKACNIDPNEYLRERKKDEPLPWDFINTGVPKEILLREANRD
jgi:radical SAM family uncharacterized protein